MTVSAIVAQLRTTHLAASLQFYTEQLGFTLAFRHEDFYAGVRAGDQVFHLKQVDEADPSIGYVAAGEHFHLYFEVADVAAVAAELVARGVTLDCDVHDTAWQTREIVLRDDQGHTLYFGQAL